MSLLSTLGIKNFDGFNVPRIVENIIQRFQQWIDYDRYIRSLKKYKDEIHLLSTNNQKSLMILICNKSNAMFEYNIKKMKSSVFHITNRFET